MLSRQYCSTPAASVQEAMAHVSSAAATLRNAVHLPPADFDAQLATAHRAASDAQAIVREMDKFEQADHISLAWPLFNCLGLVHHLQKDHAAAAEALRTAVQSVEAGARQGLAHDSYIDMGGVLSDLGCTLSAAGEPEKAQAAFGRALYMCSRAYRRDAQTISMIRHNMAVSRLVHDFELDTASDSIAQSISGLAPTHIDGQSAAPQKDPNTRGQALLTQALLAARQDDLSEASVSAGAAVPLLKSSECAQTAVWLRDRDQDKEWTEDDSIKAARIGHPRLTRLGEGLVRCLEQFEAA